MTTADEVHTDATTLVQNKMLAAAMTMTDLIGALLPFLSADQADAVRVGMRSATDCPTALLELRYSGLRITLVAYVRGEPVVLAEHTSPPVPIPTADSVRQGAPL